MKQARLVAPGLVEDRIFDLNDPGNRDRCFEPYAQLQQGFHKYGIELHTPDRVVGKNIAFDLHMNVAEVDSAVPSYVMLLETPAIHPPNGDIGGASAFRKVFTWNDDLVDGETYIKLNFPSPIAVPAVDGFAGRDSFCCLIAGNKQVAQADERELYSERVKSIRWFEQHAAQDFVLYGIGWDKRAPWEPPLSEEEQKAKKFLWFRKAKPRRAFPSYAGKVVSKADVLRRTRFSICYENLRDYPGYITEKIFDCFFSGCVPVYWGPGNIHDYIPEDCFIDRRNFKDTAGVYDYLKSMTEQRYCEYQENMRNFVGSEAILDFGCERFVETLVQHILKDVGSL